MPQPDLVVNTTPAGMIPGVQQSPWPIGEPFPANARVYDLIYKPSTTLFMEQARGSGLATANGLGMLVEQALLSFECWTGTRPDKEAIFFALAKSDRKRRHLIPPSQRMQRMQVHFFASIETRVQELVSQGCDVVRLDIGSPDMPPHPLIIQALQASVEKANKHGYQPHSGPRALREAWVEMYRKIYGVQLDPDRGLVPLIGSKEGIFNLMMALVNPGDVVLIPDPGYITYTRGSAVCGWRAILPPIGKGLRLFTRPG